MLLTKSQREAVNALITLSKKQAIVSLAGPAGTGKTTCMAALASELGKDTAVVTPTNKAAAVLRSKGVQAETLYAVFFTPIEETPGQVKFVPNYLQGSLPDGKLKYADVIIVDEASMLQTWLVSHLRQMCRALILVGDQHQLPPVGDRTNPDGFFCGRDHDVCLTEVLRQDEGSPILTLATHIRQGRLPGNLLSELEPRTAFAQWYNGSQKIIAFTNNHRKALNRTARIAIGRTSVLPQPGDVMVCNTNINEHVYNGSELIIESFNWVYSKDWKPGPDAPQMHLASVVVRNERGVSTPLLMDMAAFLEDQVAGAVPDHVLKGVTRAKSVCKSRSDYQEGAFLSYGYAITAHKAQGSEWPSVLVIDERFVLGKVDPTGVTARRWCYTAITRASKELIFADFRWVKTALRAAA